MGRDRDLIGLGENLLNVLKMCEIRLFEIERG